MSRDIEDRIHRFAGGQHGVVSRAQLAEAGLSASAVSRRVKAGRLHRLHRGVYLVGPLLQPWTREMAAALGAGPDGVISHLSALPMWGIGPEPARTARPVTRLHDIRGEPVHVSVTGRNRGRHPGIRLHRVTELRLHDRGRRFGIPVTAPGRTIVDVAGISGYRELEGVVARAEREGLVDREELLARLDRARGRRGTRALRHILAASGGPAFTRSEAEARFLHLIRDAGLPEPRANVAAGPYELDFLWPTERLAVEIDGFRYHSSRPRFEGDRRKDAWLLGRGITVVRLSWSQLTNDPLPTAVQVAQALARAQR